MLNHEDMPVVTKVLRSSKKKTFYFKINTYFIFNNNKIIFVLLFHF